MVLFNVFFPVPMLMFFPPIVFFVIVANFLFDSLILYVGSRWLRIDFKELWKKSILKVWIFGFIADFIAAAVYMLVGFNIVDLEGEVGVIGEALIGNVFTHPVAFVLGFAFVALAGAIIYFLNRRFSFTKTDLDETQRHKLSLLLAILTAPYLMLFPANILYMMSA